MLDFLRNMKDANTVDKIEGALLALDVDAEAAAKTEARAREAMEIAIDGGDAKGLDQAERALEDARRQRERLTIARGSLERRLAEARAKAEADRLDAIVRGATARRDAIRKRIEKELIPAFRTACAILEEIKEVDYAIQSANDALLTANAGRRIDLVEESYTPYPPANYGPAYWVTSNTVIPRIEAWQVEGWRYFEPGFPAANMLASAYPQGAVGDRGETPRAHVARPGGASTLVHFS
jgi:hypothetical protein